MDMKKILIYSSIILAALAVSSCTHEPWNERQPGNGDGVGIDLRVKSAEPRTKAFPDGEDDFNENAVYTLDYFVFDVNPAENTSTEAVAFGRFTYDSAVIPVDEASSAAAAQIIDLKKEFGDDKKSGYIYVIANLPDAETSPSNYFEVNDDGQLQQVVVGTETTTTVLNPDYATLQAVEVVASFQTLTDGKFTAQKSFVMTGLKDFTLTGTGPDPLTVELSRIASKVSLDMNIIKYLAQYTSDASAAQYYQNSWFPNVEKISVYLNYANPKGLLSGTYEGRKYEIGSYFSYDRNGFIPNEATDGEYKEKVLEFDDEGNVVYNPDGSPSFVDGNVYPAYNVTGTPFYSYPTTWDTSDATAPFIKIIIPWVAYDISDSDYQNPSDASKREALIEAAVGFPNELVVDGVTVGERNITKTSPSDMENRGGHEFYYKINLPASLDGGSESALQANYWYKLALDIAVLGSDADDLPVELIGDYYIVGWSDPEEEMGGDLNAGKYLQIKKSFEMYGNSLEIPFTSSGPVVIVGTPTATYETGTGGSGSLNYSSSSSEGTNFTIATPEGKKYVQLDHEVLPFSTSFSASNGNAKDIVMITYKFRVALEGAEDAFYEDVTVNQYPSIYVARQISNGYPFVNGNGSGTPNNANGYTLGGVSNDAGSRSTYFTIVSISTLSGLADTYPDWVIGEPRIKLSAAYNGTFQNDPSYNVYTTSNEATQWRRTDLGSSPDYFDDYLVGASDASNVIAPRFMLATGYGYRSSLTNSNWKSNSERCATYQEDGYPAGRWRLPTEAEILFCATLASNGLIESPFVNGTRYWACSGGNTAYGGDGTFSYNYNQGTVSVRCIYDLWYWGDEPVVTPGDYQVMFAE